MLKFATIELNKTGFIVELFTIWVWIKLFDGLYDIWKSRPASENDWQQTPLK